MWHRDGASCIWLSCQMSKCHWQQFNSQMLLILSRSLSLSLSLALSNHFSWLHHDVYSYLFLNQANTTIKLQARSESMSSVFSAAGGGRYGAVAVTGEALFSISYNYKAGAMEVYIKECRNLAPVKHNRSDPWVNQWQSITEIEIIVFFNCYLSAKGLLCSITIDHSEALLSFISFYSVFFYWVLFGWV